MSPSRAPDHPPDGNGSPHLLDQCLRRLRAVFSINTHCTAQGVERKTASFHHSTSVVNCKWCRGPATPPPPPPHHPPPNPPNRRVLYPCPQACCRPTRRTKVCAASIHPVATPAAATVLALPGTPPFEKSPKKSHPPLTPHNPSPLNFRLPLANPYRPLACSSPVSGLSPHNTSHLNDCSTSSLSRSTSSDSQLTHTTLNAPPQLNQHISFPFPSSSSRDFSIPPQQSKKVTRIDMFSSHDPPPLPNSGPRPSTPSHLPRLPSLSNSVRPRSGTLPPQLGHTTRHTTPPFPPRSSPPPSRTNCQHPIPTSAAHDPPPPPAATHNQPPPPLPYPHGL